MIETGSSLIKSVETIREDKEIPLKELIQSSKIVEKLAEKYLLFQKFVKDCFNNDSAFTRQVQLAHQDFMNYDVGKFQMAEILAGFTDKMLRKGGGKDM